MADADFIPDNTLTETSSDGELIRISFLRDDGQSRVVTMHRTWLPQLLAELQSKIAPGQATPINRGSLQIGANFRVQGFQAHRNQDGSAVLTLAIDLTDQGRIVTLPIDLEASEREQIIQMLGGQP